MKLTVAQKHYRILTQRFNDDKDAMFVANVIMTSHDKAGTKLKHLVRLLERGFSVKTASFNTDLLLVNGERQDWSYLDTKAEIECKGCWHERNGCSQWANFCYHDRFPPARCDKYTRTEPEKVPVNYEEVGCPF